MGSGRVAGKVAFVTGAARGQGRAHAVKLASEGADVILLDVCAPLPGKVAYPSATVADLEETVRQVEKFDRRAISVVCDVRDLETMRTELDAAVAELGRLDIVVANAGIGVVASWDDVTPEMFQDMIDVNLKGVWHTVITSAPHLIAAGGGSMILVSSAGGLRIQPYMTHYVASKFAVTGLAKAFAAELAQHDIRVNSLHPTGVDTDMSRDDGTQAEIAKARAKNPRPGEILFNNLIDVRRVDPEDLANGMLFLASDESRYVTALSMTVDAGITMH